MKALADALISLLDLAEAEGRAAARRIVALIAVLALSLASASALVLCIVLAATGLRLAAASLIGEPASYFAAALAALAAAAVLRAAASRARRDASDPEPHGTERKPSPGEEGADD